MRGQCVRHRRKAGEAVGSGVETPVSRQENTNPDGLRRVTHTPDDSNAR